MRDDLAPNEPLDADTGPIQSLRPVVLVAIGGALGTSARYLVSAVFPALSGVPVGIFVINISGAFLLGVLLEVFARRGPDVGLRRVARLFLGTGVLGGYTTYSALVTDTALLLHDGHTTIALAYALGSVLLGAGSALLGIVLARSLPARRKARV